MLHDLRDPPEQRRVVARPWQRRAPYVMGNIDRGVHPCGSAKIERLGAQHLAEPRHRQGAFGKGRGQRVEVGHRAGKHGNGADREADVAVGVLGLEEPRIERRQLLHMTTFRRPRALREGQRSRVRGPVVPSCSHGRDQGCVYAHRTEGASALRGSEGRVAARQHVCEELGVVGEMPVLCRRQIGFVVDRPGFTRQFACPAIHAFIGIDVHGSGTFVDAIHWALLDTRLVHHVHACTTDHVGHGHNVWSQHSRNLGPKASSLGDQIPFVRGIVARREGVMWRWQRCEVRSSS